MEIKSNVLKYNFTRLNSINQLFLTKHLYLIIKLSEQKMHASTANLQTVNHKIPFVVSSIVD
jgi:hypothetical protein